MRWRDSRRSENIDDRRSMRVGRRGARGGIVGIIIAVVAILMGADPQLVLGILGGGSGQLSSQSAPSHADNQAADFTSAVLATTEDAWDEIFEQGKARYQKPILTLFSNAVQSGCGYAKADMGPFYCPADSKLYIDLNFYKELAYRHSAAGDFAQAYVIAHEVGHHVQNLLGLSKKIHSQRLRLSPVAANQLSVRQELQADCFAGIWANYVEKTGRLEVGDIDEALNAALQIGDDTLQKKARGHVVEEAFTHGSGAQRMRWFKRGYQSGSVAACDTFKAASL